MTLKRLLLAPSLLIAAPAFAELHPDPGMNTPSAAMLDPVASNPWTVSGGKANGNSAKTMQMLMWMNPLVKQGRTYHVSLTVSGMSAGVVEVSLGSTMTGSVAGGDVLASSISSIADNFTTASGLTSISPHTTPGGDSADSVGAFRIFCSSGTPAPTDPVVYPGLPGRSHMHTPWGNTESLHPNGSYSRYRTRGGTTCGNNNSKSTPINRSAYWMPSMLDGLGNIVQPLMINLYYKREHASGSECSNPAFASYVPGSGGACVHTPTGLRYISGYDFATGLGGPADGTVRFYWECHGAGTNNAGHHAHLSDFFHGGCAKRGQGGNAAGQGGMVGLFAIMANCWDGVRVDSANHRDHMSYWTRNNGSFFGGCPDSHPYRITSPQPQVFFEIDDAFVAGKWHWSSDEMVAGAVSTDPGKTAHMDFTNGWSPAAQNAWETNCQDAHNSCSSGDLGDGTAIKDGGVLTSTSAEGNPDLMQIAAAPLPKGRYYPTALAGISKPITANGTYTFDIVASASGRISLMAIEDSAGNGFNGQVDNFSVTPVN